MDQNFVAKVQMIVEAEREEILKEVSEEIKEALEPIPVHVVMGDEKIGLYGDYFGNPSGSESSFGPTGPHSDITIYAIGFSNLTHDEPGLRKKIKQVLMHEYGHYLGFSEQALRDRGIG